MGWPSPPGPPCGAFFLVIPARLRAVRAHRLWVGAFLVAACSRTPEEPVATTSTSTGLPSAAARPACPPDPEPNLPPLPVADVLFPDALQGAARVTVELVQSDHDVERGLMFRTSMPADHGML